MQGYISEALVDRWLATYKEENYELLKDNPEFAQWLEREYVPIAGGWQY